MARAKEGRFAQGAPSRKGRWEWRWLGRGGCGGAGRGLAAFLAACAFFVVVVDVPVVRIVGVQFLDKVVTCPLLCMSYSSC